MIIIVTYLTLGSDSSCLLATLADTPATFEKAMKNISCSSDEHDLSNSLSLALTTISKYRVRGGVDLLGRGWMPWYFIV
jgi:hypothetical protein